MDNTTNLSLLDFLDTIGAALDSRDGWSNSEDIWEEYKERSKLPDDRRFNFTDWSEVGPAMKSLAAMIRSGVFK